MPQGPLGFPRVTNLGPFSEVEAAQEFQREDDPDAPTPNLFLDREISIIHPRLDLSNVSRVDASLTVREIIDQNDYRDDILGRLEKEMDIATRDTDVGTVRYYYVGEVGRIIDVKVDSDFRRKGIATRLKNLELDYMEDRGVEVVYTDVVSRGGYNLAKKTGFKPIGQADHIEFTETSLTFTDTTGVMFSYL